MRTVRFQFKMFIVVFLIIFAVVLSLIVISHTPNNHAATYLLGRVRISR